MTPVPETTVGDVPEMIERVARAMARVDDHGKDTLWEAYVENARAAIAEILPWQLIDENTPRDGSPVILGDTHNVGAGFWDDGHGCHRASAGWFDEADRGNLLTAKNWPATHWMPFPAPPSAAALGNTEVAR